MTDTLRTKIEQIRKKHEYLTFLLLKDDNDWRCGIVQNENTRFITFYDLSKVSDKKREIFLQYADKWWWESGQNLPIDSFIGKDFDQFQNALSTIPKKMLSDDPIGPVYSLGKYLKRIKKRRIDIIKRAK